MSRLTEKSVQLLETPAEYLKPVDYARRWWFPRRNENRPVSPSTVYRWAKRGVQGVRLKLLFTPDGAVTSEAACREFLSQVDRVRRDGMAAESCIDATDQELAKAGLISGRK